MTEIPAELADFVNRLDEFIEREIKPLEEEHIEFFDHRREWRRTDWENGGVHRREWLEVLGEMRRRADAAGFFRYALPSSMGGLDGTNLGMAVIRDHLAAKGLGLHNDLQTEASVVGNLVFPLILDRFGTSEQKERFMAGAIAGEAGFGFNLTEPSHGSDATWLETRATRDGSDWLINGAKRFASGGGLVEHAIVFARTSGKPGEPLGITAFIVDTSDPGYEIPYVHWTFNMPSDHAEVVLNNVRAGAAGDPVAVGRARDRCRAAAHVHPRDRSRYGLRRPDSRRQRPRVDVQLPRQPPCLRRRRPRDAGPRRARLHTRQAVRTHLPPPSPLPDHRMLGGDSDPQRRRPPVRIHQPLNL
jgi:acyl-CoA dehydrogenase